MKRESFMVEVNQFKESYSLGRLLWVKGAVGLQKIGVTYELLRLCEVKNEEVMVLTAHQFVDMLSQGIPKGFLSQFRALILRDFERLEPSDWNRFMKCLQIYQRLRFGLGVRMILISSDEISFSQRSDLLAMKPVVIRISGEGNEPGDLNDRVHAMIERASLMVRKRILRVSERAAAFLETTIDEWDESELLELLVRGIFRSEGSILRFADLLPQNSMKMAFEETCVTI
jgi:hypothetical protein